MGWRPPSFDIAAAWEAPPLPELLAALAVPGVRLVAAQGEEIQGELVWIQETFGVEIHEPPEPVKLGDLDEHAAFLRALDPWSGRRTRGPIWRRPAGRTHGSCRRPIIGRGWGRRPIRGSRKRG